MFGRVHSHIACPEPCETGRRSFSLTFICSVHRLLSCLWLCVFSLSFLSVSLRSSPLFSQSSRSLTDLSPIISVSLLSPDISFPVASLSIRPPSHISVDLSQS